MQLVTVWPESGRSHQGPAAPWGPRVSIAADLPHCDSVSCVETRVEEVAGGGRALELAPSIFLITQGSQGWWCTPVIPALGRLRERSSQI